MTILNDLAGSYAKRDCLFALPQYVVHFGYRPLYGWFTFPLFCCFPLFCGILFDDGITGDYPKQFNGAVWDIQLIKLQEKTNFARYRASGIMTF